MLCRGGWVSPIDQTGSPFVFFGRHKIDYISTSSTFSHTLWYNVSTFPLFWCPSYPPNLFNGSASSANLMCFNARHFHNPIPLSIHPLSAPLSNSHIHIRHTKVTRHQLNGLAASPMRPSFRIIAI